MRLRKAFPAIVVTPVFLNFTLSEHRLARGGRGGLNVTVPSLTIAALSLNRASGKPMRVSGQRGRSKFTQRRKYCASARMARSITQVVSASGPTPTLRIHVSRVVLVATAAEVGQIAATRVIACVHHNIMEAIAREAVNHSVSQDRAVHSIKHTVATLRLAARPLMAAVA
jgi:hypothetical protein